MIDIITVCEIAQEILHSNTTMDYQTMKQKCHNINPNELPINGLYKKLNLKGRIDWIRKEYKGCCLFCKYWNGDYLNVGWHICTNPNAGWNKFYMNCTAKKPCFTSVNYNTKIKRALLDMCNYNEDKMIELYKQYKEEIKE